MANDDSIHELVLMAQAGNRHAFEDLVKRFQSRLERQIQSRMGPKVRTAVDVEDILQETLTAAYESITKLRWQGEESFYRWLASIAEHLIWAMAEKRAKSPLQLERDPPVRVTSPSRELRRKERFDRLEEALNRLSKDHREVVVLARLQRLSFEEISRRMGRSPNAVKKLLARALLEMRRSFGDTESLHLPDKPLETREPEHGR